MKKVIVGISVLSMALPLLALAVPNANVDPCDPSQIGLSKAPFDPGCVKLNNINDFVGLLLNIVYFGRYLFWIIALAIMFWAAYKFLKSQGEPAGVQAARQTLVWAIVAIIIALIATSIPLIIRSIVGG